MSTPRQGHSATLLPDGNILVCGGANTTGMPLATCEISVEQAGEYIAATSMGTPRSSHTATLLPNGFVLVAGGSSTVAGCGGAACNTAELYNPMTGAWTAVTDTLQTAKYNHTATLLRNGLVLICGGQSAAGAVTNTCDLFDPAAPSATAFSNGPNLATARTLHSATLISTGRVFITGGFNGGILPTFLANSEMYFPDNSGPDFTDADSMGGAHSLATGRAYHTATAMGNGKVLISGGYNGNTKLSSYGILDSAEIYDPVSDSVIPAARMVARIMAHSSSLIADGQVWHFGGLGNITTNYFNPTLTLEPGSNITGYRNICPPGGGSGQQNCATLTTAGLSTMTDAGYILPIVNPSSSTLRLRVNMTLFPKVTGIIQNGEILFSTPSISYPFGTAYLNSGLDQEVTPSTGLKINLAGTKVYCDNTGCGRINEVFSLRNITGSYGLTAMPVNMNNSTKITATSCVAFTPTDILSDSDPSPINPGGTGCGSPSTINATISLQGLPVGLIGSIISSANVFISGNITVPITNDTEYTIALTSSFGVIPAGVFIISDGNGNATTTPFAITLTQLAGTVITSTDTTTQTSPVTNAEFLAGVGATFSGISGTMRGMVSRVDVGGSIMQVAVTTVIIRNMVMADDARYIPADNQWTIESKCASSNPGEVCIPKARFGHASTLLPNGNLRFIGGRSLIPDTGVPCNANVVSDPACGTRYGNKGDPAIGDLAEQTLGGKDILTPNWTRMQSIMDMPRANHTNTLLPDGTILVAGGTNGPSVLASAELLDPKLLDFSATKPMNEARDLHTATLLPNGRVLVAGGFSTNSLSSGPTASAELYFPDTKTWLRVKSMNVARDQHTAVLLPDGNVLVMGGFNDSGYLDSAEIYYSSAAEWRPITSPMCAPRARFTATLLQDRRILLAGGINATGVLNTACVLDAALVGWSATGAMAERIFLHSASLLLNGRVLTAGGSDGFGDTGTSQIYNPLSNTWTSTKGGALGGNFMTPRYNHAAITLPNGNILTVGGARGLNDMVSIVDLFDTGRSSWSVAGFLSGNRGFHSLAMAPNNVLFAIGGYDGLNFMDSVDYIDFDANLDNNTTGTPPNIRKSSITSVSPSLFLHGSTVTLRGSNFMGYTEASGGSAGSANSSHFHPRVYLQAVDSSGGSSSQGNSGFLVDLTTRIYNQVPSNPAANSNAWDKITGLSVTPSSITIKMPGFNAVDADERGLLPAGWYHLRLANNAVFSQSQLVRVGVPLPTDTATGITSTPLSTRTARFDWSWPAAALPVPDGYNLYLASSGVLIATVPFSNPASYIQTDMFPNTTAAISIVAFNMTGDGPKTTAPSTFTFSTVAVSLTLSDVTFSTVRINWNVNENKKGTFFEISQSTDDPSTNGKQPFTTSYSTPATVGPDYAANTNNTTNFFDVPSLTPNTTYYYRIRAYNASFLPSNYSVIIGTITRAAVENLTGSRCNGGVDDTYCLRWTWKPVQTNGFKVYSSSSNDVMANIAAGIFQYDQIGLGTNTAHSVRVSALGSGGEGPLAISATNYTYAATPILSGPPIIFYGTETLTFAWGRNQNSFDTAFEVSVGSFNVKETTFTTNDNSETMSFTASNLIPAEIYVASVSAFNAVGARSGYLKISTTVASTDAREVSNLRIITATPSSISIAWDRNGNASTATFSVRYSSDNFVSNISTWIAFSDSFNGLAATISGLSTNVSYTIRVTARSLNLRESIAVSTKTTTPSGGALQGSLSGITSPLNDVLIDGTLGNGRYVALYIPAGAYPIPVNVTISSIANTAGLCPGATNVSISINVEPELDPVVPVILSMRYRVPPEVPENELGNIDPLLLTVFRRDTLKGSCVPMKTSVDTTARLINVTLNKLTSLQSQSSGGLGALDLLPVALNGSFMAGEVIPSAGVDGARIFPNPFTPRRESFMTFLNMPANARIRIYSMRGDLVYDRLADAKGMLTWPGLNKSGREVASGVYFAIVEHVGATLPRKTLKLVVHR